MERGRTECGVLYDYRGLRSHVTGDTAGGRDPYPDRFQGKIVSPPIIRTFIQLDAAQRARSELRTAGVAEDDVDIDVLRPAGPRLPIARRQVTTR